MNEKLGWKIAGMGATLLVVALGFMVCLDKEWNQVWAAWIQAIGSVVAICYAFYIADGENRRREARDMQGRAYTVSRLEAIAKHVAHLASAVKKEKSRLISPYAGDALLHSIRSAANLVAQINIETVSGVDHILAWLEVRQVIVELEGSVTSVTPPNPSHYAELERRAISAKLAFTRAEGKPS